MTIRDYLNDNYDEAELRNIMENGCEGGTAMTLIYYHETVAFHDKYENEIWEELDNQSNDIGENILVYLVQKYNIKTMEALKNYLCWWAVENMAEKIVFELNDKETPNEVAEDGME
jgi:hypothetical protein